MSHESVVILLRDADKELDNIIATVVDKPMTPASGTKHDYMSMGRYWWPNPDTKNGLPYVRKDGVSNPEIEKLDRIPLGNMSRSIRLLSVSYAISNQNKYADKAIENIRAWFLNSRTKMNPHLSYGQTIPGHNNGLGRGEGLIDTYNFMEVLDGAELLGKRFNAKRLDELKQWFSDYLDWMLSSPIAKESFETLNNHGTAFDVQVVRYALFTGRNELAKEYIEKFAERRLATQIQPDGAQPHELERTTAFGYSVFNLAHMLDMCALAQQQGIDLINWQSDDGRSIKKALDFLVPYIGKRVSDFPYQQIRDWDKVQRDLCWQLYRYDKLAGSNHYKAVYANTIENDKRNIFHLIF